MGLAGRVGGMLRRDGGAGEEHWSEAYEEPDQGWRALRDPEASAARARRIARLWLGTVAATLPVAGIALMMAGLSWTRSQQASLAAESAAASAANVQRPLALGGCAERLVTAEVEAQLAPSGARWTILPEVSSRHIRGELHIFTVHPEWPGGGGEGPILWSVIAAPDAETGCSAVLGPTPRLEMPPPVAPPVERPALSGEPMAPADAARLVPAVAEWAAAWDACDQDVLRRLAAHTGEDALPCSGLFQGWRYAPGTARLGRASVSGDGVTVLAEIIYEADRYEQAPAVECPEPPCPEPPWLRADGTLTVSRVAIMRLDGALVYFVGLADGDIA